MRKTLLASVAVVNPAPFFNTHAGYKLYVCATPQPAALADAAAYAGLTWVQVKGVGSVGETGLNTNILTYDTWDDDVDQKAKGRSNAGDPVVEVARNATDAGQVLMRTMGATNLVYAFKVTGNDLPDANPASTPTIRYNRGLVTGPRQPNGRNEDFDLDVYTLGLMQKQITVNPVAGA